nr:F0F1 ATP synthase subunit B [Lentibacillus sp. JNUCC-1]
MTMLYAVGRLNVGDMIFQLVFFIVLLLLVGKFAWRPVVDMMQKREQHIASEIDTAEQSRAEAEKDRAEAAKQLKQTRQEAQQIIEDAKDAGTRQEKDIVLAAREEAERIKTAAQEEINNEKEKALQELQDKVASLSVMIAGKVIEKEISAQDQEKLIDEYIKEAGGEK